MQITVLIDNTSKSGLLCEWGLSFLIDTADRRILLDFGAGEAFAQNAAALGIELASVDCAVLSHAHHDHGGGIPKFLELNRKAPLYIAAAAEEDCWAGGRSHSRKGLWASLFGYRYIGLPAGTLSLAGDRILRVPMALCTGNARTVPIGEHAWIVPHCGAQEAGRKQRLYRRRGLLLRPDGLEHELTLACESGDGLVVLSSCSHAGPEAILAEVRSALPGRKVSAYIGGLHLYKTDREGVLEAARAFREAGVEKVWAGHCTGDDAIGILKERIDAETMCAGMKICFPNSDN